MAKKYYAQVDNIIYGGKRYNRGDVILVDDKAEMNKHRWLTEKEYEEKQAKVVKATVNLTPTEKDHKIADLQTKLTKAEDDLKEANEKLKAADDECAKLKAKLAEKK